MISNEAEENQGVATSRLAWPSQNMEAPLHPNQQAQDPTAAQLFI